MWLHDGCTVDGLLHVYVILVTLAVAHWRPCLLTVVCMQHVALLQGIALCMQHVALLQGIVFTL